MDPRQHEAPSPTPDPPPTPAQRGTRVYAGAFEAVLSPLVGGALGWGGDWALGTGPWLALVGLGLGFVLFIKRLMRLREVVEAEAAEAARRQESD